MQRLTETMRHLLKNADLEEGELNDVPMSTAYAMEDRKLIAPSWRKAGHTKGQSSESGRFPHYFGVKLTEEGLRTARELRGLENDSRASC